MSDPYPTIWTVKVCITNDSSVLFWSQTLYNVLEMITIFIRYEIHAKCLLVESGRQSLCTSTILPKLLVMFLQKDVVVQSGI